MKTKEQLLEENKLLQKRVKELTKPDAERKRTAEEELKNIFALAPDMIATCTPEGKFLKVSPSWEKVLGYKADEMLKLGWAKLVHPDDLERTDNEVEKQLKGEPVLKFVNRFRRKDGTYRMLEWRATPSIDGIVYATARDITEREKTESCLRESEERLNSFMDSATEGFILFDSKSNYVDINKTGMDIFPKGTKKEDIIGKNVLDIVSSLKKTGRYDEYVSVMKTGKPLYYEDIVPDPKFGDRHLDVKAFKVNDGLGIMFRDITESKKAEEALKKSEEKWHSLVKNAPNIILIVDHDGTVQFVNHTAPGMKPEDVIGKSQFDFISEEYHDTVKKAMDYVFRTDKKAFYEISGIGPYDRDAWYSTQAGPVKEDGKVVSVMVITSDITERRKTEEALRKSEQKCQDLYDNAPDMFVSVDAKTTKIVGCNQTLAQKTEYTKEEIIGRPIFDMYHPDCMKDVKEAFNSFGITGEVNNKELQLKKKDGTKIDVMLNVSAVRDKEGIIIHSRSAWRDITESKKAEEALRVSEARFKMIYEFSPIMIDAFDENGRCILWNKQCQETFGWTIEEINAHDDVLALFYPDPKIQKQVEETVTSKPEKIFREWHPIAKDGSEHVCLRANLKLPDGMIINIGYDVTESKKAEEELKEAASLMSNIIDSSHDLIFVKDRQLRTILCNKAFATSVGKSPEEMYGKTDSENGWAQELIKGDPTQDIRGFEKDDKDALNGKIIHNPFDPANVQGRIVIFDTIKLPLRTSEGDIFGVLGISRDITENKKAEERIQNLAKFPSENPNPVLRIGKNAEILYANKSARKVLTAWKTEVGKKVPKDWSLLIKEIFRTGTDKVKEEKIGDRVFSFAVTPVKDADYANLYGRDITESKKAEESLNKSRERVGLAIKGADLGMWDWSIPTGEVVYSDRWVDMLGYRVGELKPDVSTWQTLMHPDDKDKTRKVLNRHFEDEKQEYFVEFRLKCKSGDWKWILARGKAVERDKNGKPVRMTGTHMDIDKDKKAEEKLQKAYRELKEAQNQLIQAGKMAAMGQLASGISHELNQPLTGIKGFAQAVLLDIEEDSPLRQDLERIVEQADRMDTIIRNVSFFARKSEFKKSKTDINKTLESSLGLLREQLRLHNIQIEQSYAQDLPDILGDANQLQQVFLNLITNARDAIDELKSAGGGKLSVTTSVDEGRENVIIRVKDTGSGMSRHEMSHIFNPFFTTKTSDGGIGLGMSIAYRILENHNARIEVDSEEGKGSEFTVSIPVAKGSSGREG